MKLILAFIAALVFAGCTTMKPVEMEPQQLQERITAGDLIQEGELVTIFTVDGEHHKFEVTAITDESVVGKDIQVPIVDIIGVETKGISEGRTKMAALSVWLILGILLALSSITIG